ncbi:hypothetical protein BABINDRAFT_159078 [Babjeviella inositovora NRRL Y-12698]|uniref:Uncharacterized protein n=1 Tax=Babjeviella inositovora NRRL Y-12698 TaxID=984486 RepID=A0A1E3QZJ4_9ASCO|nr:uncharacterized protein BABINDRAFT_159078 [Babjeviella inositovora NRRL Y-12698]ODQ82502.1 hypothetical protein BABINDRAFT_159078 [Babjeviella inositovora NRRL Y-12698]
MSKIFGSAAAAAAAASVPSLKGSVHVDSLDTKIIQYSASILKLEKLIERFAQLSSKTLVQTGVLPLLQYITLLPGSAFNLNDTFVSHLARLSDWDFSSLPSPGIKLPGSTNTVQVTYDDRDFPLHALRAVPRAADGATGVRVLDKMCRDLLALYVKRLTLAKSERAAYRIPDSTGAPIPLDIAAIRDILEPQEIDAVFDDLFITPGGDDALATLQDMDLKALSVINAAVNKTAGRFKAELVLLTAIRSNSQAIRLLPHWEYTVHRIAAYAFRINDLYILVRRAARRAYVSHYAHLHETKFLHYSLDTHGFRVLLTACDEQFNNARKNGVLIATITRLIRTGSNFPVRVDIIADLMLHLNQGYALILKTLSLSMKLVKQWTIAEYRYRTLAQRSPSSEADDTLTADDLPHVKQSEMERVRVQLKLDEIEAREQSLRMEELAKQSESLRLSPHYNNPVKAKARQEQFRRENEVASVREAKNGLELAETEIELKITQTDKNEVDTAELRVTKTNMSEDLEAKVAVESPGGSPETESLREVTPVSGKSEASETLSPPQYQPGIQPNIHSELQSKPESLSNLSPTPSTSSADLLAEISILLERSRSDTSISSSANSASSASTVPLASVSKSEISTQPAPLSTRRLSTVQRRPNSVYMVPASPDNRFSSLTGLPSPAAAGIKAATRPRSSSNPVAPPSTQAVALGAAANAFRPLKPAAGSNRSRSSSLTAAPAPNPGVIRRNSVSVNPLSSATERLRLHIQQSARDGSVKRVEIPKFGYLKTTEDTFVRATSSRQSPAGKARLLVQSNPQPLAASVLPFVEPCVSPSVSANRSRSNSASRELPKIFEGKSTTPVSPTPISTVKPSVSASRSRSNLAATRGSDMMVTVPEPMSLPPSPVKKVRFVGVPEYSPLEDKPSSKHAIKGFVYQSSPFNVQQRVSTETSARVYGSSYQGFSAAAKMSPTGKTSMMGSLTSGDGFGNVQQTGSLFAKPSTNSGKLAKFRSKLLQ